MVPEPVAVPPAVPAEVTFRPFGTERRDLDIEFETAPRPAVLSALIEACAVGSPPMHPWYWTISLRAVAAWRIAAVTEGVAEPAVVLRCRGNCAQPQFEIHLPVPALWQRQLEVESLPVPRCRTSGLAVRRPCGMDEARWLTLSGSAAARRLTAARDLITEGMEPADPAWIDSVSRLLEEADPLAVFSISCECPVCGSSQEHRIDLARVALQRLQRHQKSCLRVIHRLASAYGWTEDAVMALPVWRRNAYLQLIRGEAAA